MVPSCAATIGDRRSESLDAAAALAHLYGAMRLFVNFFQPSSKLAAKPLDGAVVRKRCETSATPCQRLLANPANRRGGATPRERGERHVGPSSSAPANSRGLAAAGRHRV